MIRKYFFVLASIILLGSTVTATDDIEQHPSCAQCGMDRKAYGFSRVLIRYQDGSSCGVCSLHCAAIQLSVPGRAPVKSIQVADRDSRILIEAEKAVWVIGGNKRGVMTKIPKWAFATQAAAEEFIKVYGGKTVPWEEALKSAKEEISEKRE